MSRDNYQNKIVMGNGHQREAFVRLVRTLRQLMGGLYGLLSARGSK